MNLINNNILTIVIFLPLAGAILLLFFPRRHRDIRYFALAVSLGTLLASLHLPWYLVRGQSGFQFEQNIPWIAHPNIHYHLGIDGISMWLVILTTFLMPMCVLISWNSIGDRVKEFFILMLVLETAMIGVFVALDLFLFYFFWEATLIPMALIIGMYGHGRKIYASVKFFLYTMIASVFMLAAVIWLYAKTGTFDFVDIQSKIQSGQVPGFEHAALWLFLGFFVAFAVKVPLFPLHTWLPDAHVEAPTAGSVLLAGVLLKMGTYGLLRFNLGLFPDQARRNAPWIIALAIIGIIYGALVAMIQPNIKRLVAYTSVSHLGLCGAGHLQLHADRNGWRRVPDAEPRHFYRRSFHAAGHDLRSPPHLRDERIRRARYADAGVRDLFRVHHAVVRGLAAAEWLHWRVHGAERRLPGQTTLRHSGGDRRHLERVLSAVDVSAHLLRGGNQSGKPIVARPGRSRARLVVAAGDCRAGHGSCSHAVAALD